MWHFPPRIPTLVPPWVHSPLAQASRNSFSTQAEKGTPILLKSIHTAYNINIQSHFKLNIRFYSGFCGYIIILYGIFIIRCQIKKIHNFTSRFTKSTTETLLEIFQTAKEASLFFYFPMGGHRSLRSCDTRSMCKVDKTSSYFNSYLKKKNWDSPLS